MQIRDHVFLITGGSSGLGAACAKRFVRGGGRVVLVDLDEAGGSQLAAELGDGALFCRADVTSGVEMETATAAGMERFGHLHGVINCAGICIGKRVLGKEGPHDLQTFEKVIQVNLIGTFNALRLAAACMAKNEPEEDGERGVIINTASCAAYEGQIGQAAYSASKAAVAGMTLPMARELARAGIRVMSIAPGTFDTPMMAGMTDDVRTSLAAQVPFPSRLGNPEEYAALAQHIVENRMLNGAVVRLDGAIRMAAK